MNLMHDVNCKTIQNLILKFIILNTLQHFMFMDPEHFRRLTPPLSLLAFCLPPPSSSYVFVLTLNPFHHRFVNARLIAS